MRMHFLVNGLKSNIGRKRYILLSIYLCLIQALLIPGLNGQSIKREYWNNIAGDKVSDLTGHSLFPNSPTGSELLEIFEAGPNLGDRYGSKISGFVIPPITGDYTFYLSGDNECELWLSSNESPENKKKVASVSSWTSFQEWDKFPSQTSPQQFLEAGQAYYIEALQKESTGGDHLSVGWQLPDETLMRPIKGIYLRADRNQIRPPAIVDQPKSIEIVQGSEAKFTVEATGSAPIQYQWFLNDNPLADFPESQLILSDVSPTLDLAEIRVEISNAFGVIQSEKVILKVLSEQLPPTVVHTNPQRGSEVATIDYIEVLFSEPVDGVEASDLEIDGIGAIEMEGKDAGPYRFYFESPLTGEVEVKFRDDNGIEDWAKTPNEFEGYSWGFNVGEGIEVGSVVISEIQAVNPDGYKDGEGLAHDWIEIWNTSNATVNLGGWSLSDDPKVPGKWVFPELELRASARHIIFASGLDKREGEFHTNFQLSVDGEFLGLFGPGVPRPLISGAGPGNEFPEQRQDFSYGLVRNNNQEWGYFSNPTPRNPNSRTALIGVAPVPHFSVERGFFKDTFELVLSVGRNLDDALTIKYTVDGSEPSSRNGKTYSSPIEISGTTIVRAIVLKSGSIPSRVTTHSYIKANNDKLLALPVISISTDRNNLWGNTGIMETSPRNTTKRGIAWERPCSTEWIFPDGRDSLQIDCGLRVQGGNYVRQRYNPNGSLPFSKYSFRLYFRTDYGPGKLKAKVIPEAGVDEFDVISLRAGMNDHSNPFVIDELVRRLHSDMGYVSSQGTFAHLFVNGEYEGYYNPTERIDDNFLNSYFGEEVNWDIIAQFGETREGDRREWDNLISTTSRDQSNLNNYLASTRVLDIDNFIDYLIVNIYAGTGDWPHNNWRAARPKVAGAKWEFLVWDAEWSFGNLNRSVSQNTITTELARNDADIAKIFQSLRKSPEFRLRFADRVEYHLYGDGVLTRNHVRDRFQEMRTIMSPVITSMRTSAATLWPTSRPRIIEGHLSRADLYTPGKTPKSNLKNGPVDLGEFMTLSVDDGAEIYFTTDGADPRVSPVESSGSKLLVTEKQRKYVLIPTSANDAQNWQGGDEPFDHSQWREGNGGVGYDLNTTYKPYISIDTQSEMRIKSVGCFIRIPFPFNPLEHERIDEMKLNARFDDGFTAYLNGVKIASRNMTGEITWDKRASSSHSDTTAVHLTPFDVSEFISLLKTGENILAIHAANVSTGSSDFLFSANLSVSQKPDQTNLLNPDAQKYDGPIQITESSEIRARSLIDNIWSPLKVLSLEVSEPIYNVRISEIMYHPIQDPGAEWIELTNYSKKKAAIGQWTIEGIDFQFPHSFVLDPGLSIVLVKAGQETLFKDQYPDVEISGVFSGNLSNKGETLQLVTTEGIVVDEVKYRDEAAWPERADGGGASLELRSGSVPADSAAGWWVSNQNGGTPGELRLSIGNVHGVVINEMTPFPEQGENEAGRQRPDWVEFKNISDTPVDISGWSISDKEDGDGLWVFPTLEPLLPGEFISVGLGGVLNEVSEQLATPFSLNRDGEALYLFNKDFERVDAVEFGFMPEGYSLSRFGSSYSLGRPTMNMENEEARLGLVENLVFNEWLGFPDDGSNPWVELTNIDPSLPIPLKGIIFDGEGWEHQIRRHSFLGSEEFIVLELTQELGNNELPSGPIQKRDTIKILSSDKTEIDTLVFTSDRRGWVYGYIPDGVGNRTSFGNFSTPGRSNTRGNESGLVINEYLAWNVSSQANEFNTWVELYNESDNPISLEGHRLINRINDKQWIFPVGSRIESGAYLLLGMDPSDSPDVQFVSPMNTGLGMSRQGGDYEFIDLDGDSYFRLTFGPQIFGKSVQPGNEYKLLTSPTPGAENEVAESVSSGRNLFINEWRASHPTQMDWFEIYNANDKPVDLARNLVSDNPYLFDSAFHEFPNGSFIAPNGWARFFADRSNDRLPWSVPFQLDGDGELLRVYTSSRILVDEISVLPVESESVIGRYGDGESLIRELIPTPGFANAIRPNELDSDSDGIPDFWELDFDLDPLNPLDALLDFDDDLLTNLQEFLNGNNPRVLDRALFIEFIEIQSNTYSIYFLPERMRTYVLEYTSALNPENLNWVEVDRVESVQVEELTSLQHETQSDVGFYRIRKITE